MRRTVSLAILCLLPLSGCLGPLEEEQIHSAMERAREHCGARAAPSHEAALEPLGTGQPLELPMDRVVKVQFQGTGWAIVDVHVCDDDHYYVELLDPNSGPVKLSDKDYAFLFLFQEDRSPEEGLSVALWRGFEPTNPASKVPLELDGYRDYRLLMATSVPGLIVRLAPASSLGESAAVNAAVELGTPPIPSMELKSDRKRIDGTSIGAASNAVDEWKLEAANPIPSILFLHGWWKSPPIQYHVGTHSHRLDYDVRYEGANGTTRNQDTKRGGHAYPGLGHDDPLDFAQSWTSVGPWKLGTRLEVRDTHVGVDFASMGLQGMAIPYVRDIE